MHRRIPGTARAQRARQARDRFAATRRYLASRRPCIRLASSPPGIAVGRPSRGPSEISRCPGRATPGPGPGPHHRLAARAATTEATAPTQIPATRCWQSAIRRQTSRRRRPGRPSRKAARQALGPCRRCRPVTRTARGRRARGLPTARLPARCLGASRAATGALPVPAGTARAAELSGRCQPRLPGRQPRCRRLAR
jgi:hypothetical protein